MDTKRSLDARSPTPPQPPRRRIDFPFPPTTSDNQPYGLASELSIPAQRQPIFNAAMAAAAGSRHDAHLNNTFSRPLSAVATPLAYQSRDGVQHAPDQLSAFPLSASSQPAPPDGQQQPRGRARMQALPMRAALSAFPTTQAQLAQIVSPADAFGHHPVLPPLSVPPPGQQEDDYGLVAELRGTTQSEALLPSFGLAAEVARRRRHAQPSPGKGLLLLAGGPGRSEAAEQLAEEMAMQRRARLEAALADPFSEAARAAGGTDPFLLADEQLKLPLHMMPGYQAPDQEHPLGSVPLRDDALVDGDRPQYGLPLELGMTDANRTDQGWPPIGPRPTDYNSQLQSQGVPDQAAAANQYQLDPDTGLLVTSEGGQGDGGRLARQYIEDVATGNFYQLGQKPGLFSWLRKKRGPKTGGGEDEEDVDRRFRARLKSTVLTLGNGFNMIGLFAQGLLAGFALLHFFMTYFLYNGDKLRDFLRYYSYIAMNTNRTYFTLIALSLVASVARFSRDKLRDFQPRSLYLHILDPIQIVLYVGAYVVSVLCTPVDDELTYEYNRNPSFSSLPFTHAFKQRLALWHLLNVVRIVLVALAWLVVTYQVSPHVFETMLHRETSKRWRASVHMAQAAAMLAAGKALNGGGQSNGGAISSGMESKKGLHAHEDSAKHVHINDVVRMHSGMDGYRRTE